MNLIVQTTRNLCSSVPMAAPLLAQTVANVVLATD